MNPAIPRIDSGVLRRDVSRESGLVNILKPRGSCGETSDSNGHRTRESSASQDGNGSARASPGATIEGSGDSLLWLPLQPCMSLQRLALSTHATCLMQEAALQLQPSVNPRHCPRRWQTPSARARDHRPNPGTPAPNRQAFSASRGSCRLYDWPRQRSHLGVHMARYAVVWPSTRLWGLRHLATCSGDRFQNI